MTQADPQQELNDGRCPHDGTLILEYHESDETGDHCWYECLGRETHTFPAERNPEMRDHFPLWESDGDDNSNYQ